MTATIETELPLERGADRLAAGTRREVEEEQLQEVSSRPPIRMAIALAASVLGAAVMVGGVFIGVRPRFTAAVAGIFGVALAVIVARLRRPLSANALALVGIGAIGLLVVLPNGPDAVLRVRTVVAEAVESGGVLRPPVPFLVGWQAVLGWLMAIVGFGAAWLGIALGRPYLGVLVPLPIAAVAGISVPDADQAASGIAVVVLFAVSLGLLASATAEEEDRPPLAFELRKAVRAIPVLVVVVVALLAASQTSFLFPDPAYDPAEEAQKPKTVPLSEVEDRVLFVVDSKVSGPWRLGSLDVYDGKDWRLPPFAESELAEVPRSGRVDPELAPAVRASFAVRGLGGAVLPSLPNTAGIVARGPKLAYDSRNGNIRLVAGQVRAGFTYDVGAAALPSVDDLRAITAPPPKDIEPFTEIPAAPPAVVELIGKAPKTSPWDTFDFVRTFVLENVTATGAGVPVSITPERVDDLIGGTKEGSPFEIVAAQAMLARWVGLPSRIGYGFDGGELVEGSLHVRPRHGASFVEVYFPRYKWLPVIGTPKHAKATSATGSEQRFDPNVLPSGDIAVQLTFPVLTEPPSTFGKDLRRALLVVVPSALGLLALYIVFPLLGKAVVRARRRSAARAAGPRARVALAYMEWRDTATDFGIYRPSDTPLRFLARFPSDEEHRELAWVTTRALWGDLRHECTSETATFAEELSRAMRRRMAMAQPATMRTVAALSRLSLRNPYGDPNFDPAPPPGLAREIEEAEEDNGDGRARVEDLVDARR